MLAILKEYIELLVEGFLEPPPVLTKIVIDWISSKFSENVIKSFDNKRKNYLDTVSEVESLQQKLPSVIASYKASAIAAIDNRIKLGDMGSWEVDIPMPSDYPIDFHGYGIITDFEFSSRFIFFHTEGEDSNTFGFKFIGERNEIIQNEYGFDSNEIKQIVVDKIESLEEQLNGYKLAIDKWQKNNDEIVKVAQAYIIPAEYTKNSTKVIPLSPELLSGWKYSRINLEPEAAEIFSSKHLFVKLLQNPKGFKPNKEEEESTTKGIYTGGMYSDKQSPNPGIEVWTSSNYQFKTPQDFEKELTEIRGTATHELIHFTQDVIALFSGEKASGLPSPNMSPGKEAEYSAKAWKQVPHPLRSLEFYTRLNDAKLTLERELQKLEPKDRLQFWTYFTTKSDFFLTTLKNSNPLKYQKAIKELYKYFQSKGLLV